jgi:hypothetical protein
MPQEPVDLMFGESLLYFKDDAFLLHPHKGKGKIFLTKFCFIFLCFVTGSVYVTQDGLELAMYPTLSLNSPSSV